MTLTVLQHAPGQKATFYLETLDEFGVRADGYTPMVTRVILPDLSVAEDFPQLMQQLDVGLYYFQYTIPTGATAVGSYLVDVLYNKPGSLDYFNAIYQIVVSAPFGLYSVTTQ